MTKIKGLGRCLINFQRYVSLSLSSFFFFLSRSPRQTARDRSRGGTRAAHVYSYKSKARGGVEKKSERERGVMNNKEEPSIVYYRSLSSSSDNLSRSTCNRKSMHSLSLFLSLSPLQSNIAFRHTLYTPFPFPVYSYMHSYTHSAVTLTSSFLLQMSLSLSFPSSPARFISGRSYSFIIQTCRLTRSYCRQLPASTSRRVSQVGGGREVRSAASTSDAARR